MTSGERVFLCKLYSQRLRLLLSYWMVEGILRGLLCCERNDAVKGFLLLAVVYAKEGKEEERLGWIGVGRGRKVGFYMGKYFMDCIGFVFA